MIKRRFYKQEHGEKDAPSDSSSSSDSELDAEASVDTEEEEDDDDIVMESKKKDQPSSSSSGYESEDSSANEVNLDSSGSPANDDDSGDENYKQVINGSQLSANRFDMATAQSAAADKDAVTNDVLDCVLKSKSVFKCKLCPRIVCLTEETLKAHLKSKRHARSEKLLKEGRLKMMLNSDGEIEELEADGETHQERHAATLALAESNKSATRDSKKSKGRQRQRKRQKKKTSDDVMPKTTKESVKRSAKKRRKNDA
ncbi:putative transcription factor C2H2 family [Helianthus annuus]|nr:putative transcription factor C2H2 family [Helianthus annuus]